MNSDFLSQLLGGQDGAKMLGILLPMILGNKGGEVLPFGKNIGLLSSLLSNSGLGTIKGDVGRNDAVGTRKGEYPPLFGGGKGDLPVGTPADIWNIIGNLTKSQKEKSDLDDSIPPYDLQYNHPEDFGHRNK